MILFNHFEEISDKMKPVGMTVLNLSAIPYNSISCEQSVPRHGRCRVYRLESVRGDTVDGTQGSRVG